MILHKIKKLCKEQGYTLSKLEEESQITQGTISNWGRGNKCMPSADKLARVAKTLGTTVEELLGD